MDTPRTIDIIDITDAPFFSLNGHCCSGKVVKVTDGDTVHLLMEFSGVVYRWKCRIAHVDTPELHSRDEAEKRHAITVKERLTELILNRVVSVNCLNFDMYGRVLVELTVPSMETNDDIVVHEWLLHNGYALPYEGKTKQKWIFND